MASSTKPAGKSTKAPAKAAAKATDKATKTAKAAAKPAQAEAKAAPAKAAAAPAKKASPTRVIPALAKRSPSDNDRKPPPKRKGPLDKFLLGQVEILKEERETYTRQAASLKAEADSLVAEREPGDVQFDEESGEGDTLAVERERDLTLSAQASAAVDEIDRALAKIKDGTYGVCEQCYAPIPKERLKALPFAALCVQCKSAGFSPRR
ncbi:MAG TPA: TraR/DksA C4-type zinc finger protein [Acidimicrobiales bacterium]|nr:TraR/DksA C4-type zinc finger protein [Acidimicrobiales bacterium]